MDHDFECCPVAEGGRTGQEPVAGLGQVDLVGRSVFTPTPSPSRVLAGGAKRIAYRTRLAASAAAIL